MTSAELAERTGRARSLGRELVSAIPAWGWVGALVCVSAGIRFAIAQTYPGPWIFADELHYSDLARSLGRTGSFAIRQTPGLNGFGPVYPALIAPAYALFHRVPTAYEAAQAINAVVMSLAAIPTYLLARRLARSSLALVAAALAVALPAMTYTAAIMTENAFYPTFVLVAYTMYLALERPTIVRQLLVFATILIAFLIRVQGIMFVPALISGVLILCLLDAWMELNGRFLARLRRGLAAYWVTWAVVGGGAVLVLLYEHARGRPWETVLGSYGGVTLFTYRVGPIARWFVYHLGEIDFAVGILPFAAFLFVTTGLLRKERSRPLRVFAAMSVPVVFWFAVTVAAYASNAVGDRIEERNFFFVAALFFVALVVWVDRGLPRRSVAAVSAILVAIALAGAVPYGTLTDNNSVSGAFGLLPLMHLEHWRVSVAPHNLRWVVLVGAVGAGLFLLVLPRRYALVAPLAVLGYLALASHPVHLITEQASLDSARAGIGARHDWVDRAAGGDANVAILFFATDAVPFWQNEFYNASVRTVYNIPGRYDGLPQTPVGVDSKTAFLVDPTHNRLVHSDYLLVNQAVLPRGRLVAQDRGTGMRLFRTPGRYVHIDQIVAGIYPDTWSGPAVGYQRYACKGGTVTVTLTSDPALHPHDQVVTATEAGRVVARRVIKRSRDVAQQMTVPLESEGGDCGVRFDVTPATAPDDVFHNGDKRVLGIRFTRFVYRPR